MSKFKVGTFVLSGITLFTLIFQNCGQLESAGSNTLSSGTLPTFSGECDNYDCSVAVEKANSVCFLDGEPVVNGKTIEAYAEAEADTCQAEKRSCDNGKLQGENLHTFCIEKALIENNSRPCVFNNKLVDHGQSVEAFLNGMPSPEGECSRETRSCDNGSLSGSFAYAQCGTPSTCLFNGRTYQSEEYTAAYKYDEDNNCVQEFRVCKDGLMTGSFPMASCVNKGKTCLWKDKTFLDGESTVAYDSFDRTEETCQQETRTCREGVMSGGLQRDVCKAPSEDKACLFAGKEITSGSIFTAYKKVEDQNEIRCLTQTRTCINGEINEDETFDRDRCEETAAKSCLFTSARNSKKIVVEHGQSIKSFDSQEADSISVCDALSTVSRCVDGSFDQEPMGFESCRPYTPPGKSCQLQGRTLADGRSDILHRADRVDLREVPGGCSEPGSSMRVSCDDGQLLNPQKQAITNEILEAYPHTYCRETGARCDYFNTQISHGNSFVAYKKESVDFTDQESCSENENSISGICHNGTLMNRELTTTVNLSEYPSRRCQVIADSCNFRGETYEHNKLLGMNFYKENSVPFIRMTSSGSDGSCTLNGNVQHPRCINGQIVELGKDTVDGKSVWVPMDFSVYKHDTCTVQGKACNAYGTTYPHAAKLGNRYTTPTLPYVDESTSCDSRKYRAALVCADGQLEEYQPRYSSAPYVQRVNVNPDDFPSLTCSVVGADCVVGTTVYRHGRAVGDTRRDRRDRTYGYLYRSLEQPSIADGDACVASAQAMKARCIDGTVRNPEGAPVDLNMYNQLTCSVLEAN